MITTNSCTQVHQYRMGAMRSHYKSAGPGAPSLSCYLIILFILCESSQSWVVSTFLTTDGLTSDDDPLPLNPNISDTTSTSVAPSSTQGGPPLTTTSIDHVKPVLKRDVVTIILATTIPISAVLVITSLVCHRRHLSSRMGNRATQSETDTAPIARTSFGYTKHLLSNSVSRSSMRSTSNSGPEYPWSYKSRLSKIREESQTWRSA